jgi:hypothetical protein
MIQLTQAISKLACSRQLNLHSRKQDKEFNIKQHY